LWPKAQAAGHELPADAQPLQSEPSADSLPAPSSKQSELQGLRLLVVDDEYDARELLSMALSRAGAEVATAESAAEAFEAFLAFQPNVLISDIGMPGEDGYSLVRRLRQMLPLAGGAIPSIALTAFTSPEDRAKALAAGFTVHVGKPIAPHELITTIARLAEAAPDRPAQAPSVP
jgi:CheY-like chemotaxis protein